MTEIKDPKTGEFRTVKYTDKDGVRTYKESETGEVVKTLKLCTGGITDDQVKGWKEQNRKLHVIEVEDDGELFVGYFRRPSMEVMSAVNKLAKTDEVKSTTTMFDNCWLGGDPLMKTDTLLRMAAIKQLGVMFDRVVGTLKNV